MAEFNDLPLEILDSVCLHLRNLCGNPETFINDLSARKALASLCLTSKKCLRIAQPHLYYGVGSDSRKARIDILATLFTQNKHLAQLVHEIYLTSDYDIHYTDWLFDYIHAESRDTDPLVSASSRDGEANEDAVRYESRVIDRLFIQLQNLNFIEVTSAIGEDDQNCFQFIAQQHVNDPSFIPKLEELSIRHSDTEGGFTLSFALPLMAVTKIQRLSLWMCVGVGVQDIYRWKFPSLRELRIGYSGLDVDDIRHLVRLCPNLELFSFEMADAIVVQYCESIASAHEISQALRPLSKTLRTLLLTQYGEPSDEDPVRSIGSLAEFSKLEHLVIWLYHLTDAEGEGHSEDDEESEEGDDEENDEQGLKPFVRKLPSSLKSLYIQLPFDGGSVSNELCKLATSAEKDFPNMQLLTVDARLDLKARFKTTNIRYRELIRHPPISDITELEKIAMAC